MVTSWLLAWPILGWWPSIILALVFAAIGLLVSLIPDEDDEKK